MIVTPFMTWCAAVRASGDDVDEVPEPEPVVSERDVPVLVEALVEHIASLRAGARYDYSPTLAALLDALLAVDRRKRPWLRRHEASLVPALASWIDNVEHGDDCLVALAQLDTEASVVEAMTRVAEHFTMREIGGHDRVVDAIDRKTAHDAELFPRLLAPLETQQAKSLVWDRWHVSTGAAIVRLANDLHKAGRATPHPLAPVAPELANLVDGGERVCTELEARERQAFETALAQIRASAVTP